MIAPASALDSTHRLAVALRLRIGCSEPACRDQAKAGQSGQTFRLIPLSPEVYPTEGLKKPGVGRLTLTQLMGTPPIVFSIDVKWRIDQQPEARFRERG